MKKQITSRFSGFLSGLPASWSALVVLLIVHPGFCGDNKEHPLDARPQPWKRQAKPILSALTAKQDWCKVVLYSPTVIYHDGKFRMWYLGTSTATRKANTVMGYAESDDGIAWKEHPGNPILTGDDISWGTLVQTPHVLFDVEHSIYKMWFVSGRARKIDERGRVTQVDQHLGYAESKDGLSWKLHPEPIYESGRSPSVIKEGPGKYRMWMGSHRDINEDFGGLYKYIYEFNSPDGIHWKREAEPIISPSGKIRTAIYPFVLKEGDDYFMWYGGHVEGGMFELFCAKSMNGSSWEIDHEHAAFPARSGKSAFDSRYTSTPSVVKMPDRYLIYYSARDWVTEYVDGSGVKRRDGASPYAHIGVAEISR